MRKGAIISSIKEGSIGDEIELNAGDIIVSINDKKPRDIIDYSFMVQEEFISLDVIHQNGEEEIIEIEKDFDEDLGISFENAVFDGIKPCCNHCIFCFVDQQPEGLRDTLYVKDDDWRLSYLQGTYVTLTNLTKSDWERIEQLRPSPLFVSIHTTNPELRVKMLRNRNAGKILENLDRLKKMHIDIHAQIVMCPGYNDGEELKRTLNDLKKFKSILKSLAVVPVGISKYRKEEFKTVDKEIAIKTIKIIDDFNEDIKRHIGMASDEFFITAEMDFPPAKYYGKFLQIEDGVGNTRLFLDDIDRVAKKLKVNFKEKKKLSFLVSKSALKLFNYMKESIKIKNLDIDLIYAKNKFFGEKISVAGLLTGSDVIDAIEGKDIENLVLPSIMLKEGTETFLDGLTLTDVKKHTNAKIFINRECYNMNDIVKIIKSL